MSNRVSLAELAAADIRLRPGEAVAIVSAICAQHLTGALSGIPSPGVIRLTREGDLVVEGPTTTSQDLVVRAALLLTDLLADYDALPEYRASGALRLVIARAVGSMDLPPYGSLDEFRVALSRFVTEDVGDVARALFSAWERARVTSGFKAAPWADLTISDVRRARRATGLSLGYLASVAEVPSTRLRDLEWGYMRDWPATAEARTQVIRYARAAGLDESIVLSIAWPMILEHATAPTAEPTPGVALVPAPPRAIAVVQPVPPARAAQPHRWRAALIGVAATVALLSAFTLGSWSNPRTPIEHDAAPVGVSGQDVASAVGTQGVPAAAPAAVVHAGTPLVPAADPEPEVGAADAPMRAKPAAAAPPVKAKRRRPPARESPDQRQKRPFLERELFRIVFR